MWQIVVPEAETNDHPTIEGCQSVDFWVIGKSEPLNRIAYVHLKNRILNNAEYTRVVADQISSLTHHPMQHPAMLLCRYVHLRQGPEVQAPKE